MNSYTNILTGKKVVVMGLGRNNGGLGCVLFALQSNVSELLITDSKDEVFNAPSIDQISTFIEANSIDIPVKYVLKEHREEDFKWADVVIKNPAVPYSNQFIQIALQNGAKIESEMTLFLQQRNPDSTVIGISGSKGKSSTTMLIYHILTNAFQDHVIDKAVKLGGNMGISVLSELDEQFNGIYVIELSSFVTEQIYRQGLSIDYYVLTALYPDHLNYYPSLEEYYIAKLCLIEQVNKENVFVNASNEALKSRTEKYNVNQINTLDFSELQFPQFFSEAMKQNAILVARFLNAKFGLSNDYLSQKFETFKVVEGRFEYLGKVKNVDFINDTCASIPEAAILGLKTLIDQKKNIYVITGGSDKGLQFDELFTVWNNNCQKIYLIKGGNTFDLFVEHINPEKLLICDNLESAEKQAFEDAQKDSNGVVILSRGCTSFGVANNEFEMGREFTRVFLTL